MNRMLLVASREYIENIRTKGFWIGIMMMPIILIMVAVIPVLVESTREAKRYAVVDLSGEILPLVDEQIAREDFSRFLADYEDSAVDLVPGYLMAFLPELRSLHAGLRDEVAGAIIDGSAIDGSAIDGSAIDSMSAPSALSRRLSSFLEVNSPDIRRWWLQLRPEERGKLAKNISSNNYIRVSDTNDVESLNQLLRDEKIFAYFVIGKNPTRDREGSRYVSNNLTDLGLRNWFGGIVSDFVRDLRLAESELDRETADWINEPLIFEGVQISREGKEEEVNTTDIARQWAPVVFVYMLWISILINTQMLITNTIEEKSNKLVEVLLSSISPIALMAGKIIGIAATGLTIIGSWAIVAFTFFVGLPKMAGVELPIDFSSVLSDPVFLGSFLIYFLLGYLLYAALLVGLGAMCNNLKEAQNLMMPVQMIQMLPLLLMIPISRDPNGTLAVVLSYIPPLTPFVMMNRAAGPPSQFEYIATTVLLVLSIIAAFWLAAKLFRIGILLTGKAPGLITIAKLLRAPVYRP